MTDLPPEWYVNCNGEVIQKPKIFVNKIIDRFVIIDPELLEQPKKVTIIGRDITWSMEEKHHD